MTDNIKSEVMHGRHGDPSLPRTLEAIRVIRPIPEDVGSALFEGVVA